MGYKGDALNDPDKVLANFKMSAYIFMGYSPLCVLCVMLVAMGNYLPGPYFLFPRNKFHPYLTIYVCQQRLSEAANL